MRDRNKLIPNLRIKLEELENLAEQNSLHFIVTQTLRSQDEQAAYYARGRLPLSEVNILYNKAGLKDISESDNKKIVTKAKTVWDSFHAYGRAFDIAIVDSYGKINWDTSVDWNSDGISDWIELGKLGESIGLEWGGNFSSMPDFPHFQLREGLTIAELKSKHGSISGQAVLF
jgi:peptidoglycan L-alanyl-D-glutamate endopeptidase CwlK